EDFPEIAKAVAGLAAPTLVLDGEVVLFDAGHVSRFQLLQRRELGERAPRPIYAVFDCLYARGRDLRSQPLSARRAALEAEVGESGVLLIARRLASDGRAAFVEAERLGLEGIVAKNEAAPYVAEARSRDWLKVKVRAEEEFVIGGFTAPAGSRTHFGA